MWALKPILPLPDKHICICRDPSGRGPLHAYEKHVRSRDEDKIVGVRKRKQIPCYWTLVPDLKATSELIM